MFSSPHVNLPFSGCLVPLMLIFHLFSGCLVPLMLIFHLATSSKRSSGGGCFQSCVLYNKNKDYIVLEDRNLWSLLTAYKIAKDAAWVTIFRWQSTIKLGKYVVFCWCERYLAWVLAYIHYYYIHVFINLMSIKVCSWRKRTSTITNACTHTFTSNSR